MFRDAIRTHLGTFKGDCEPILASVFIRGDANIDRAVNIADALKILGTLFSGGTPFSCMDAADVNDDGAVNIGDAAKLLIVLFQGGDMPRGTVLGEPERDATRDRLDCAFYPRLVR